MLIHVVADYGHGDLAFAEVAQRLTRHLPGAVIVPTPVPAFDTVSAGFCVAQLALTPGPRRVVFHNVAPRADTPDPRPGNQGERLVCATLPGDVLVIGANAGHCFSFVRDEALSLRDVPYGTAGSQFRSRDFFPELVAHIVEGDGSCLGEELRVADAVADLPERQVVYVDGYGNLKTSWFEAPTRSGERVEVTIEDHTEQATVSDGTFEVPAGELSFAPGSSGWRPRRSAAPHSSSSSCSSEAAAPPLGSAHREPARTWTCGRHPHRPLTRRGRRKHGVKVLLQPVGLDGHGGSAPAAGQAERRSSTISASTTSSSAGSAGPAGCCGSAACW